MKAILVSASSIRSYHALMCFFLLFFFLSMHAVIFTTRIPQSFYHAIVFLEPHSLFYYCIINSDKTKNTPPATLPPPFSCNLSLDMMLVLVFQLVLSLSITSIFIENLLRMAGHQNPLHLLLLSCRKGSQQLYSLYVLIK